MDEFEAKLRDEIDMYCLNFPDIMRNTASLLKTLAKELEGKADSIDIDSDD